MWVQLDYTCFLPALAKLIIGSVFILGPTRDALVGTRALFALADMAAFILLLRNPHGPL